MATTKKITKRERFNTLLNSPAVQADPDMVAFIEHEIELLDRKNTVNGEKKVNEKMVAAKQTVMDFLATVDKASVADVANLLGCETTQFPTSVLTQLTKTDGLTKREVIKGKSYYSLA